MTLAVCLTIFASFLWAVTNHIDKFMINGINEAGNNIKTLLVFSTLVTGVIFAPICLIVSKFQVSISMLSFISVILSSFIYILATYLYYKALEKNDASMVVVMFQLIPVFSYLLELIIFKENLTIKQTIGSLVIISSTIFISINFEEKNKSPKWLALILMTLSSLLYAIYFFLFDIGIRNSEYISCIFWFQIGFLILGIFFICIKSFRVTFFRAIKTNGKRYLSLNITNEVLNIIANSAVNFANLIIPLALANVLDGFQGAFAFILGVIGMKLLPKYFKETISKKIVIQKIGCILLSILGLAIMFI